MRTSKIGVVAAAAALTLTLAACGSDNTDEAGAEPDAAVEPLAENATPVGEMTEVTLDEGFLAGLETLGLTPGVLGDSELNGAVLSFPISGGNITAYPFQSRSPYIEGVVEHDDQGISLTAGDTTVELVNFDLDAGASVLRADVSANGTSVGEDVEIFFLDGSTLMDYGTDPSIVEGTTVSLTAGAATLLNDTFGTDVLTEFFTVGVAKITLAF